MHPQPEGRFLRLAGQALVRRGDRRGSTDGLGQVGEGTQMAPRPGRELVPRRRRADEPSQVRTDPASLGPQPGQHRRDVAEVGAGSGARLGLQYVLRDRFRDSWVHDTPATGFGCDFLQDAVVDAVLAERCGRLDNGEQPGGAGIGIGIGGWGTTERLTVTACTARGNGTNGIFIELQQEMWPPPRGIRITACHVEDNRFGISDWGADGLVVTGCTMIGNHEAGFDISAQGTAGMAGRGGMVVNCIIDGNLRDGIGNTPGPYTITGSRISANGRYGYWQHPLGEGYRGPAIDLVLDGNSIRDNGLDGIRVDAGLDHCAFTRNRIRNNGRRAAPATSRGGSGVSYGEFTLTDETADWRPDGHRGKHVTVAEEDAVVLFNTATTLGLAPHRPGAESAWRSGRPAEGTPYQLPGSPRLRAGITLDAPVGVLDLDGNRIWDDQEDPSQTHATWTTERASGATARAQGHRESGDADE